MNAVPVSDREFGELVERVSGMQRSFVDIKSDVSALTGTADQILLKISGLEGGWKVLLGIAGGAAMLGGIVVKVLPLGFHF